MDELITWPRSAVETSSHSLFNYSWNVSQRGRTSCVLAVQSARLHLRPLLKRPTPFLVSISTASDTNHGPRILFGIGQSSQGMQEPRSGDNLTL